MKILTIKQPWASLIANNIKLYEFRTWKTNYRGPVLIHAGATIDKDAMENFKHLELEFPTKKIVAVCEIADCLALDDELNKRLINEKNIAYGSKWRDGYAFKLVNIKKLDLEDEVKGKLGLWNAPENIIKKLKDY